MKICYIADGSHINTLNWAGYFANALKHEIHIVSFNDFDGVDLNIKHWPIKTRLKNCKLRYIVAIPKVKKIIRVIKPDIVIGYRITSYGFMAAASSNYPLVIAGQGQYIVWPRNSIIKKYFAKYAVKRADLIQSWADHMTFNLIRIGAKPERILTLTKGVDTELFKPNNTNFQDNDNTENKVSIISTRALKPEYKIDTLIKAVAELNAKNKIIFNLKIIGTGTQKKKLVDLVRSLGAQKYVQFLGQIQYAKIPELYRNSNIFVSTVPSDGVSSSLLEAMACGIFPIVVDNLANRQWIKDGENGYLYKAGDVRSLIQKIENLVQNNDLKKSTIKKNIRIVKEKACIYQNMKKFESVYLEIIYKRNKNEPKDC